IYLTSLSHLYTKTAATRFSPASGFRLPLQKKFIDSETALGVYEMGYNTVSIGLLNRYDL
ncbi:MAG: hypothetical protein KAX38_03165, partial [Candidatus Krumholzibacteria bacterium]|nr:hypothetical protein [Candidatus Krumholzibacteria bacterium]